jgi:XTP/dITP diphosphohydrolase
MTPYAPNDPGGDRTKVVFATRNPGKVRELVALCSHLPIEIISAADIEGLPQVEETGDTFEENAKLKAMSAARATSLCALADDSGLEVDALAGRPGVRSARYSGVDATDEKNLRLVLREMKNVPWPQRTARFRCAAVFVDPHPQKSKLVRHGSPSAQSDGDRDRDGDRAGEGGEGDELDHPLIITAQGSCEGYILEAPKGCSGFGYDPVFYFAPWAKTFAEISSEKKNSVSHRARAIGKMVEELGAISRWRSGA